MKIHSINKKANNIIYAMIYTFILAVCYKLDTSIYWSYMGFNWNPTALKIFISISTILVFSLLISNTQDTRSILLTFSLYFHIIPSVLFFSLSNQPIGYLIIVILGNILIILSSTIKVYPPKLPRYPSWRKSSLILSGISLIVLIQIIIFSGLNNFNLNMSEVYEFRSSTQESLPGIFGYLRPITTKVIIPLGIIISIAIKSRLTLAFFLIQIVLFFGFTNHKVIIFSSLLIVMFYIALKSIKSNSIIPIAMIFLVSICLLDIAINYANQDQAFSGISSIVIRRSLFVPPLLDSLYYDVFSMEKWYYWSQSKLSMGLIESPHKINAPYLVGMIHFGNDSMSANTGYIGSGYANAGIIGIIIYSSLIGLVISLLNIYGKMIDHKMVASVFLVLFLGALRGSDLTSVFLTHGLLFLLLLFAILPRYSPQPPKHNAIYYS